MDILRNHPTASYTPAHKVSKSVPLYTMQAYMRVAANPWDQETSSQNPIVCTHLSDHMASKHKRQ